MKILAAAALLGCALTHAVASPLERGALRDLPPMKSHRAAHTATLLNDGSVLLVGGFSSEEDHFAGVELFDPRREEFQSLDDAIAPRHSHTASLLPNGSVLIAGGYGERVGTLDTTELFDPSTRRFVSAARMKARRAEHTAVTLADGRVAFIGGRSVDWATLATIEIYDPTTRTFSEAGRLTVPRTSHASVLLRDGRIFIAGGHAGRGSTLTVYGTAEIFDPKTGRSSAIADIGSPRHKLDCVVLADGKVLITGGSSEEDSRGRFNTAGLFDPARNSFTPAATMHRSRYKHRESSLLLANGKVLVAGGARQAELYDPSTDTFTLVDSDSPLHGSFSSVVSLQDGRVLVAGGYFRPDSPTNGAWIYRPSR